MVIALAVASPSTSSGLHISCPSGPVIPNAIIFSDCWPERHGGRQSTYINSKKAHSCNKVSILGMDLSQSSKLFTTCECLQQLQETVKAETNDQLYSSHGNMCNDASNNNFIQDPNYTENCIHVYLIVSEHEKIFVGKKHLEGVHTCRIRNQSTMSLFSISCYLSP